MKHHNLGKKEKVLRRACLSHLQFVYVWYRWWTYIDDDTTYTVKAKDSSPEEYHILANAINKHWELIDASC